MMWKVALPIFAAVLMLGQSVGMPGGKIDRNVDDKDVRRAVNFTVAEYNSENKDNFVQKLVKVVKVESQVVAGIKYFITMKFENTTCLENGVNEVCSAVDGQEPYQCEFQVWSRPWLNLTEVVKKSCH
ncbi:cystatin-like [Pholidichthys leucotaenia]